MWLFFLKFVFNIKKFTVSIGYVEAHGTGTVVGDKCEVDAIVEAYCEDRETPLLIGSIKTNLGHTEATACLTSIAKVILIFEHELIPANLHLKKFEWKN